MKFYTWKDIERYCLIKRNQWNEKILSIDAYPDEMIVYMRNGIREEQVKDVLYDLFPRNFDKENDFFRLDRDTEQIRVSFETQSLYPSFLPLLLPYHTRVFSESGSSTPLR